MSVCGDLADDIVTQQGIISKAGTTLLALGKSLTAIFNDMITAKWDIQEIEAQVATIDAEIAKLLAEARTKTIAEMDEMLAGLQARIAEILLLLNGHVDTPPVTGSEAAALSAELAELEAVVVELTAMREEMVTGTAEPILTAAEQATKDAKLSERGEAERLLADLHVFQDELEQQQTALEAQKEEQISNQEAADEFIAVLEAEATAAGCGFTPSEPNDPEQDPEEDPEQDPEEDPEQDPEPEGG